jgi:hypothetical protein
MGAIVEKRMKEIDGPVPQELVRIYKKRGFMESRYSRRSGIGPKDNLPLTNLANHTLYLRLVSHALIGAARPHDLNLLERLAQHTYSMVASAAATRLTELAGDRGIKVLQSSVTPSIEQGRAKTFGLAVRAAEIQKLGLTDLH